MAKSTVVLLAAFLLFGTANACELLPGQNQPVINFPHKFKENLKEQGYIFSLLRLALQKTEVDYGPCRAHLVMNALPVKRTEMYLEGGDLLQVVDLSIRTDRTERFLVVPVPLYKGLAGNRIFLIRKGESAKFADIQNVESLKRLSAGQGEHWADTSILRANGLTVKTTANIDSLIDMLTHKRFDYFPRGAAEIFSEINIYGEYAIEVEPALMITYPFMTAFHLNKQQTKLAERLSVGLDRAIDDGALDKLFYAHTTTRSVLTDHNFAGRRIIPLCNPNIPDWVPLEDDRYWIRPWPATIKSRESCGDPGKILLGN